MADEEKPGSFLLAILTGNLDEAERRADEDTAPRIPQIFVWLARHAPTGSCGNPEVFTAWLAQADVPAHVAHDLTERDAFWTTKGAR